MAQTVSTISKQLLQCPRKLHPIHQFQKKGNFYVADLNQYRIFETDALTSEILKLCESLNNEEIIEALKENYSESMVKEALQELWSIAKQGFLFFPEEMSFISQTSSHRLKIIVPIPNTYVSDIRFAAGGTDVVHHHLIEAMASYADIYVAHHEEGKLTESVFGIPFRYWDPSCWIKILNDGFHGILMNSPHEMSLLYLHQILEIPFAFPMHTIRGDNGQTINSVLLWHTVMRSYDAFFAPTHSVKQFYSQLLSDTGNFHIIPWGVDTTLFRPMNKAQVKQEVAQSLQQPQVLEKPVVGFLSRFQPEKGASTYLQIAQMNPDFLFLIVAPSLNRYEDEPMPKNVIYAGKQTRERLPLFFNAFDIYCFPSVVGEETFGLAVLEAMACGIPPVVGDFDGLPEVVGDAGKVVPARNYQNEIGSIAGYISPEDMSESIRQLMSDDEKRYALAAKARQRALMYTWDRAGRELVNLFKRLNSKKQTSCTYPRDFHVIFSPYCNPRLKTLEYTTLLLNTTEQQQEFLMHATYQQTIEEGLALSLLKEHTLREVHVILKHIYQDKEKIEGILNRVREFRETTMVIGV